MEKNRPYINQIEIDKETDMARYKFVCKCSWTWYSVKTDNVCPRCGEVIVGIEQ